MLFTNGRKGRARVVNARLFGGRFIVFYGRVWNGASSPRTLIVRLGRKYEFRATLRRL